jgi:hypothetical protein
MSEFVYFIVPFEEKDKAKAVGARWDNQKRKWCMPCDHESIPTMLELFATFAKEA